MVAAHNVFAQRKTLWNWKASCIEYRQRRCSNVGCCTSQCEKEMRYEMLIDHIKRCRAEMMLETLALPLSSFHFIHNVHVLYRFSARLVVGLPVAASKTTFEPQQSVSIQRCRKTARCSCALAIAWIMISGSVPGIHSTRVHYFVYVRRKTDKH